MDRLLFLASSIICTKQMMTLFNSTDDCTFITYIIEQGHLIEGKIIGKLQTAAFQNCLQHCSKERKCTAVNFLIGVQDDPICLLIDRTMRENESEMPIPESVIYSATSFCLSERLSSYCTDNTIWSFERFPNKDLIDDNFANIVDGKISLEKCLISCLKNDYCRAVLYNKKLSQCRYLNISIQNVHNVKKFFKRNEDVELYENNCFSENLIMNDAQCQFIRMQSSGFTDFFDERNTNVSNAAKCEQLCLTWNSGNCRYFTYHRGTRMCYLSHTSPRTLNKNPLQNYDLNLSSGDLEDCIQFKVKCKPDRMHIHGTSLKMFSGTLTTKNNKKIFCERKFLHVYELDAEMLYDECGMQKSLSPYLTFSNLIMLKEGSTELITIKDKLLKVVCHIHSDLEILPRDQHLSFRFEIEDENATKQIAKNIQLASQLRNYITQPRYTMEVMDVNKNPTEVVQIGDKGYLILTLHEKPIDFSIINLLARDTHSGKTFTIIDSDGCIVPNGILKDIYQIDKNHLQLAIVFDGFSDETDIIYEAYAIPCDEFCIPNSCNQINSTKNQQIKVQDRIRKRRSMIPPFESRLFQLSGDLYAVKSSNKLKFRQKLWEAETENNNGLQTKSMIMIYEESLTDISDNAEGKPATINQLVCIADDMKCLIIFLALCLQALVLIVIFAITYTIIQYCLRQQRNSEIIEVSQNIDNKPGNS
ncbi:Beta-glucosidase-like SFR2, chloroplastic [Dirofilaria immitis]